MPNRVIYVPAGDETFWERAESRASDQGVSLSKYVGRLIRNDVIKINTSSTVTDSDLADTLDRVSEELRKRC